MNFSKQEYLGYTAHSMGLHTIDCIMEAFVEEFRDAEDKIETMN